MFLDIYSEKKILTSKLTVNFVSLDHRQYEWLQENSRAD